MQTSDDKNQAIIEKLDQIRDLPTLPVIMNKLSAAVRDPNSDAKSIARLIEDDLASREFMPVIQRIRSVSSFATPSTWEIDTDRGPTTMVLKGEEDIRRLARPALLIADSRGINFLIRDRYALDPVSKKMLDRFL